MDDVKLVYIREVFIVAFAHILKQVQVVQQWPQVLQDFCTADCRREQIKASTAEGGWRKKPITTTTCGLLLCDRGGPLVPKSVDWCPE